MYPKLTYELERVLRSVASQKTTVLQRPFEQLVEAGFVTHKIFGGLIVNSKGWKYLQENPPMTESKNVELYQALEIFACYNQPGTNHLQMEILSNAGLISHFTHAGWIINDKGREYIAKHIS